MAATRDAVKKKLPRKDSLHWDMMLMTIGEARTIPMHRRDRAYGYAESLGIEIVTRRIPGTKNVTLWRRA